MAGSRQSSVRVARPPCIRALTITAARIADAAELPAVLRSTSKSRRLSASQKAGLRYEEQVFKHVQAHAQAELDGAFAFTPKPWFHVKSKENPEGQFLQPDFILVLPGKKFVVGEIKLRATRAGCEKLMQVYVPAVQCYLGADYTPFGLLMCQWFEPGAVLPHFSGTSNPLSCSSLWQYHIWNPRYSPTGKVRDAKLP